MKRNKKPGINECTGTEKLSVEGTRGEKLNKLDCLDYFFDFCTTVLNFLFFDWFLNCCMYKESSLTGAVRYGVIQKKKIKIILRKDVFGYKDETGYTLNNNSFILRKILIPNLDISSSYGIINVYFL